MKKKRIDLRVGDEDYASVEKRAVEESRSVPKHIIHLIRKDAKREKK